MSAVLVTGAAGFIGHAVCQRLLDRGERVVGVDVFNDYYDVALKRARAARLAQRSGFRMLSADIAEPPRFMALLHNSGADRVVHLAAQAGVRYSMEQPFAYQRSNLAGHLSVLEACRHRGIAHLVYASSSSVYGERSGGVAFREEDAVDQPASLYAVTKRSGELMSQTYSKLYGLRQSGLRFFTVYGPWGRPDMAYYSFTQKILGNQPIEIYGEGRMARDFTYIDDIVDGVLGVLDRPGDEGSHRLFNIGNNRPVGLMRMIELLEQALGREAIKRMLPMQPGDVSSTCADVSRLHALTGYAPKVTLEQGLPRFVDWYRRHHGVGALRRSA